jgi:hypothetical protein
MYEGTKSTQGSRKGGKGGLPKEKRSETTLRAEEQTFALADGWKLARMRWREWWSWRTRAENSKLGRRKRNPRSLSGAGSSCSVRNTGKDGKVRGISCTERFAAGLTRRRIAGMHPWMSVQLSVC